MERKFFITYEVIKYSLINRAIIYLLGYVAIYRIYE